MQKNNIILIQVWLGRIPDYFWFHYETTKNIKGIDFLLFTDQDIKIDSENYKVINTNLTEIKNSLSDIMGCQISIKNNKKTCDLKASFGCLFYEYIKDYDYFGCYDIDTLFGDVHNYIKNYLGEYDFITMGDSIYHNRLSGPFLLMKNTEEIRNLFKCDEYIKCFDNKDVECFEENILTNKVQDKFKIKIIYSTNVETFNGGKNTYSCFWSGGKVYVNNDEKMIYHFYRKNNTNLTKLGNSIVVNYNKKFIDDFYWVVSFTKNYENYFTNLLESIKKYSNRKCIIYSINYDYVLPKVEMGNEQFIIRRINIEEGSKDFRGRDNNIISSKPVINLDVINAFPNKKFVSIDSDIYLTVNSDDISNYLSELENYPLINSHIHETIYLRGINPDEEWTSSLHVLLNEMNIDNIVIPRRKTNVLVFDDRSEWFFKEQMEIYGKYKGSKPGILALHDEDTANAILCKYNLKKCLHMVDIEEVTNLNMEKFYNYSYNMTPISYFVKLPKNKNEILFFHGIKSQEHFDNIKNDYDLSNIECEELCISYKHDTLFIEKNSFLDNKKFENEVIFKFYDKNMNELFSMGNQKIRNYFLFYITNVKLLKGKYFVKIFEEESNVCIFKDILEVL